MKCKYCGEEFESKNPRQTYCSSVCRKKMKLKTKDIAERKCESCGKTFLPRSKSEKFCSAKCGSVVYRRFSNASR